MKIVQINSVVNGSTGKIMMSIHNELIKNGHESYIVWGRGKEKKCNNNKDKIYMMDKMGVYMHVIYTRFTGKTGFASKNATKKLIEKLDNIKPDIIHLHNIHGYYINIEALFNYLKGKKIRVIWTLHDCWPFTGQCPHFAIKQCEKWKTNCYKCPMIHEYPKTLFDNSQWNYKMKKELFSKLDMTLVAPSQWLANRIRESYLKEYKTTVINNGINLNVFKPTKSNIRKKHNIEDKKIILGVASNWDTRKGLEDFIKLSKIINSDYVIILVGLTKKQIKKMPKNIIGIAKTENQQELAGIYSTADILFNPTYEDNYPTINIEALACGTPVLTYDTGGSVEFEQFIKPNGIKYVLKKEDVKKDANIIKEYIDNIISRKIELKNIKSLDEATMIRNYIKLYNESK